MKADFLRFDAGTYQSLLKIVSYKDGWNLKIREYVHERIYDFENRKPNIEDISVYVLEGSIPMFKYRYTRRKIIDNYGVK